MASEITFKHAEALSTFRWRLLREIRNIGTTLESIADRSGVSLAALQDVCRGHGTLSYPDIAKVTVALYGDDTELMVTVAWADAKLLYPGDGKSSWDEKSEELLEVIHPHKLGPNFRR